jgi:hypothetical protein
MRKEKTSFLKKRSKKLLSIGARFAATRAPKVKSLFASFSSEKEESS